MAKSDIDALFDSSRSYQGLWRIDGLPNPQPGILRWANDRLTLMLTMHAAETIPYEESVFAKALSGPKRPTIVGYVSELGTLTLGDCMERRVNTTESFDPPSVWYSVYLDPMRVWQGDLPAFGNQCDSFSAIAEGLYGVIIADDVKVEDYHFSGKNGERPDVAMRLDVLRPDVQEIAIKAGRFKLLVGSTISHSSSAMEGHDIRTKRVISFYPDAPIPIADALDIKFALDQFLSLIAVERMYTSTVHFDLEHGRRVTLIWERDQKPGGKPMRHQALCALGRNAELAAILEKWYAPTPNARLARWLFSRALDDEENSVGRFLAIAQAWEVLGRDLPSAKLFERQKLQEIRAAVESALEPVCDEPTRKRILGLISSSNRSSYPDTLEKCFQRLLEDPVKLNVGKASALAKRLADLRNSVVHMKGSEEQLNDAFRRTFRASYLLIVLFALHECVELGIPVDVENFLNNNSFARYALSDGDPTL